MDQGTLIFYKRGKGRVTKSLSVYQFKNGVVLHFLTFDRTELTREQKKEGLKEQRIKTLDTLILFDKIDNILAKVEQLPHQNLVNKFLEEYKKNGKI